MDVWARSPPGRMLGCAATTWTLLKIMTRGTQNRFVPGAFRAVAAFCVLFLVVSGFAHAALHASQPAPGGIVQVTASALGTMSDDQLQLGVEAGHCLACAVAAVPMASVTTAPSVVSAMVVAKPSERALQKRQRADPPPPKA